MRTAVNGILVLAAVALPLAGCGIKSSPEYPPGSTYSRTYPAPAPSTGSSTGSAPLSGQPEAKRKDGTAYSPLGFPLEYPNRPTY